MILPCTSPPNAIYANMKALKVKLGVARPVRLFWPVIKNAGQYGQTRPACETERPDQMCYVNIRAIQSGTALRPTGRMPTTENGGMWPQCYIVSAYG